MKRLCAVCLALCILALCSGCGRKAASVQSAEETVLTFMIPQGHYKDFLQDSIDCFEEEYPYISIDMQIIPDNQWNTVLKRVVAVGETPDLIRIDRGLIANVGTENFVELTEEEPWYSRVLPDQLEVKMIGGKLYGLPIGGSSCTGLICNRDLFEQYNVKMPETMEEFLTACETFKAAGVTALYVSDRDAWTVGVPFTTSAPQTVAPEIWEGLKDGSVHWNEVPEFEQILQTFSEVRKNGYTNADRLEATYTSAVSAMAEGKAAMYISGQYFLQDVLSISPDADVHMLAVPYQNGLLSLKPGLGQFAIFKNSNHVEEAKLFLNWFSQPENMSVFGAKWGHTAVYCDQSAPQSYWEQEVQEKYIDTGKTVYTMDVILDGVDLDPFWNYQQELVSGILTPSETLSKWDVTFRGQLEKGVLTE